MAHPYTTVDDYPKKFREMLIRVGARFEYDSLADKLYIITSVNGPALTNSERYSICQYLVIYKHAFKRVSFKED